LDHLLQHVPLLGPARRHWALARFTRIAHSGLLAALPPQEWLQLAADASDSAILRQAAHHAAARVADGDPIAPSLRGFPGLQKSWVDALETAEQSGTLDDELARWAALESEEAGAASARAAEWLPRILYGAVMLYVAWRIITMIHGIYAPVLEQLNAL
jgi:type II secretory pathway component PulF